MENAVEALKMAAAVLIFVISIVNSFSLFGTAKETADSIITIRDKQAYLQAADLDGGILYTSSSAIKGDSTDITERSSIVGVTTKGDRIVEIEDIISTIYRYSIENYGVTILERNGTVIARYDSNTEQVMSVWNNLDESSKDKYVDYLKDNTKTEYITTGDNKPNFSKAKLEELYAIKIAGENSVGVPWYGNELEIQKRIGCDLYKGTDNSKRTYTYIDQTYKGIDILNKLEGHNKIVEVTNEIDNSTYLKQTDNNGNPILDEHGNQIDSNLLERYEMPTIEIVYIVLD